MGEVDPDRGGLPTYTFVVSFSSHKQVHHLTHECRSLRSAVI